MAACDTAPIAAAAFVVPIDALVMRAAISARSRRDLRSEMITPRGEARAIYGLDLRGWREEGAGCGEVCGNAEGL